MKKTILSLAVAAGMTAGAANAEVYGILHASIDSPDNGTIMRDPDGFGGGVAAAAVQDTDAMTMESNTSAIGVKGSEDLGDGLKAFYKAEFQIDISERNQTITDRDQYIGLKGGMGMVKFGSMSSNYKQMGGKIDPMYRTALEGRGQMSMQSNDLHAGAGRTRGRMTDLVQYASPKMGGMQLVINTTFDGAYTNGLSNAGEKVSIDETMGVGFRYEAKSFSFYIDMIDMTFDTTQVGDATDTVWSESAMKIGGTFETGPVKLGFQHEMSEELAGADYTMLSVNYSLDKNNAIYLTMGQRGDWYDCNAGVCGNVSNTGSTSFALMYDHNMSKNTDVYVGYGSRSDDDAVIVDSPAGGGSVDKLDGYSVLTAGMRVRF